MFCRCDSFKKSISKTFDALNKQKQACRNSAALKEFILKNMS